MNRPLRSVSFLVTLLMAALLANITWLSVVRADPLNDDPRNRRVREASFSENRGTIFVGNTPIAESVATGETSLPYQRSFADPTTYSSVTGWYSFNFGSQELERSYAQELAGTSSEQAISRIVDILSGRKPQGASLHTSLNATAQQTAVAALGDQQGAVIAMDYTTGEILALVSTPTYDPNSLASLDFKTESENWYQLLNAPTEPLKNRAIREVYPPGSTFKLVTAAAALEAGMAPDTMLAAPDKLPLPQSSSFMANSTNCGGTEITLQQALETSCNTAFGALGMQLGADALRTTAEKFGFNSEPTIDLPAAKSRFPTELDEAQTALSAIGQFDVAASPLQMLRVTATIANDGVAMRPHVVSNLTGSDLRVLRTNGPQQESRVLDASHARQLQEMMISVVENGTGRPARIDGMRIGGKTGTAQSAPDRPPYAWFVGFADKPSVAIAVFVQSTDAERDEISGGRVAAPIFRAVLKALR
ncbi:MAG: cell division protein FtsI [Arachnia propionica]|nr:MAG: cell division protein FtsI [Arachnia propionica]